MLQTTENVLKWHASSKLIKRGISLFSLTYKDIENAFGGSVRQIIEVQAGVSKEKGKEIIQFLKEQKLKFRPRSKHEQLRVTAKSRDELQTVIALLKEHQDRLKVPMQFGNYRD